MRCAVEIAPVRVEPRESAEQVTQALLHEPLRVTGHAGGWTAIITVYDYPGWMRAESVEDGDGVLPLPVDGKPLGCALELVGSPYEWGGLTARGIDCSGLVHIAYRTSGRLVPRDAWQQEAAGASISQTDARPGDLVAYGTGARADHIAFWLGPGRILHATAREGLGVAIEDEPESLRVAPRRCIRL